MLHDVLLIGAVVVMFVSVLLREDFSERADVGLLFVVIAAAFLAIIVGPSHEGSASVSSDVRVGFSANEP